MLAGELFDGIDELVIRTYPTVQGAGMPVRTYGRKR